MRKHGLLSIALCGFGLASACGGDGGGGPSQSELVGTWQVTKCEYVSTQGLGTVDLIAVGGTGSLILTATDTLILYVTPASGPPVTLLATYEIRGTDLMRVTPAGASWYWAFDLSLSGNTLKLTNGSAQYNFNGDGTPDAAKWNLFMSK
jgi:hypothetical protein